MTCTDGARTPWSTLLNCAGTYRKPVALQERAFIKNVGFCQSDVELTAHHIPRRVSRIGNRFWSQEAAHSHQIHYSPPSIVGIVYGRPAQRDTTPILPLSPCSRYQSPTMCVDGQLLFLLPIRVQPYSSIRRVLKPACACLRRLERVNPALQHLPDQAGIDCSLEQQ
jgi:hypothetical protein